MVIIMLTTGSPSSIALIVHPLAPPQPKCRTTVGLGPLRPKPALDLALPMLSPSPAQTEFFSLIPIAVRLGDRLCDVFPCQGKSSDPMTLMEPFRCTQEAGLKGTRCAHLPWMKNKVSSVF